MALASQIMQAFSYVAVVVAVASAFVASSIYYVALAKQRAALSPAAADMKSRQPRSTSQANSSTNALAERIRQ